MVWRRDRIRQLAESLAGIREARLDEVTTLTELVAAPPLRAVRRHRFTASVLRMARRYRQRWGTPDVVHAHCALWGGLAGLQLSKEFDRPLVITEHFSGIHRGSLSQVDRADAEAIFRAAAGVAAVSPALAARVRLLAPGREVTVLPNAIDTDFFTPDSRPRIAGRILAIGNLVAVKAFDYLLQAFASLSRGNLRLVIGGDGPERGRLARLAQTLGIADRVLWLGALTREQVRDEMRTAELFVLPSRSETFGVVLLEAAASGLRYVSTDCGGPSSFTEEPLGQLCPVDRPEALARAIEEALGVPPAPPEELHRLVVERFGPRATVARLLAFYGVAGNWSAQSAL
jgi:glycosyltransferase involved in cell wall biosynthesis